MPTLDQLHKAMSRADDVFSEALIKRYGRRAFDMRHRTRELPTELRLLALGYQRAVEEWRKGYRGEEVA